MHINKNKKIVILIIIILVIGGLIFIKYNNKYDGEKAFDLYKKYMFVNYGKKIKLENGNDIKIDKKGNYVLNGKYECITIDTNDEVKLNLKDVEIKCNTGPGINIINSKLVSINIKGKNQIESNEEENGAIKSDNTILLNGKGSLNIKSNSEGIIGNEIIFKNGNYEIETNKNGVSGKKIGIVKGNYNIKTFNDGITSDDIIIDKGNININVNGNILGDIKSKGIKVENNLVILSGNIEIESSDDAINSNNNINIYGGNYNIKSGDDGIHGDKIVNIYNGNININKSYEGMEGEKVIINKGNINIKSSDDSINAKGENEIYIKINGGNIKIESESDGLDSNGNIYINGGNTTIEGASVGPDSAIDFKDILEINGGELIAVSGIGANDKGEIKGSQPIIYVTLNNMYKGEISIDKIKYIPSKSYKSIIISSSKLKNNKEYKFNIGNEYKNIKINNNFTKINNFI